ncbi:MAG: YlxM family DNA-binding protein [Oscillospiraceae bacterium]|nr:YlxM family DNA-binding protein [Oscillospiraceae bacterium]
MKNQAFHMTMLYDFYGDLLTERQREFYDLYHNEDLSLAEIAENYDITRQGVRDVIVRAEAILNDFEEKTGIVARFLKVRSTLDEIAQLNEQIAQQNQSRYRDGKVDQLTREIQQKLASLEE